MNRGRNIIFKMIMITHGQIYSTFCTSAIEQRIESKGTKCWQNMIDDRKGRQFWFYLSNRNNIESQTNCKTIKHVDFGRVFAGYVDLGRTIEFEI